MTKVLEGSVRRSGDRIRVTAQLISAADGTHMWSERYDRAMSDVFAIQDEIAQAIATAFRMKMAAKKAGLRAHTPPLPAYEAFLRGRHLLFKFTPDGWERAKVWLDQAITLDPEFADPHMVLALGYILIGFNGIQPLQGRRAGACAAAARSRADPQPVRSAATVSPRAPWRLRTTTTGTKRPSDSARRWMRRTCRPTRAGRMRACI